MSDCKGDFSVLKLVKAALRNKLSTEHLKQLMAIKIDAESMETFLFSDALKKRHQACVQRKTTAARTAAEKSNAAESVG